MSAILKFEGAEPRMFSVCSPVPMSSTFIISTAASRIVQGALSTVQGVILTGFLIIWDLFITLLNAISPSLPPKRVVPFGKPGTNGFWPAYKPPGNGDSRCSCPALNALANHGKLSLSQLYTHSS